MPHQPGHRPQRLPSPPVARRTVALGARDLGTTLREVAEQLVLVLGEACEHELERAADPPDPADCRRDGRVARAGAHA